MHDFWELSLLEIRDITDSFRRVNDWRHKRQILDLFSLAEVTANRIGLQFSNTASESDKLQPWHLYPALFEDRTEDIEEQKELIETQKYKAQFNRGVALWNERFKKEQENGSGKIIGESHGGNVGRTVEVKEDP